MNLTNLSDTDLELELAMSNYPDCIKCEVEAKISPFKRRMIVCPTCGNKRCPKASDHELECTGSNEVGQPGSYYIKPEEL